MHCCLKATRSSAQRYQACNIFKNEMYYKLGDFGSACLHEYRKTSNPDGTLDYISPELRLLMMNERVEVNYFQSYVFSLGITVLHLAKLTFPANISVIWRNAEAVNAVVEEELRGLTYFPELRNLLKEMFLFYPHKRPKVEDIRKDYLSFHLSRTGLEDDSQVKETSVKEI